MAHILFIDSNKRSIRAMTLARRLGHRVTFVHNEDHQVYLLSPISRKQLAELENVISVPSTTRPDDLEPVVRAIHKNTPVDAVICLYEFAVDSVAEVAHRVGIPFTDAAAARLVRRKDECRGRLAALGVPSARFITVDAGPDALSSALWALREFGAPIIMKPASGADSMLAQVVHNEAQAKAYVLDFTASVARLPKSIQSQFARAILIEEFLVGPLVSVEVARTREGVTLPYMVSGRRCGSLDPTVELSFIMPAAIPAEKYRDCFAYAEQVMDAVGLDFGFFHIEMIITASGPRLVEINPRMMGGNMPLLYENLTGVNLFEHLIDIHLGKCPQPPEIVQGRGVASVRFKTRQAGTVSAALDAYWIEPFGAHIISAYLDTEPTAGLVVDKGFNFGGLQVRGTSGEDANCKAGELLRHFEEVTSLVIER